MSRISTRRPRALDYAVANLALTRRSRPTGCEFYSPPQEAHNLRVCFCLPPDAVMTASSSSRRGTGFASTGGRTPA